MGVGSAKNQRDFKIIMDLIEKYKFGNNRHPWEISRRVCILSLIKNNPRFFQYADIGAGDLFFAEGLKEYTEKPIYAVDTGYVNVAYNENKIRLLKDVKNIPFSKIDCIFLMDILEHVSDENRFLELVSRALKNNGTIIITVPAFQALFSTHDIFLKHFRRYSHKSLVSLLRKHDLYIEEGFYFYTSLLIIFFISISNLFFVKKYDISSWRLSEKNIVSIFIKNVLNLDFLLNRFLSVFNIMLPGLSLCIVCRKKFA